MSRRAGSSPRAEDFANHLSADLSSASALKEKKSDSFA
jgi:hypothetical protein